MSTPGSHTMSTPRVGDIWKEVDPRVERYVRVEHVGTGRRCVAIRTVIFRDSHFYESPRSRISYADIERFNGKRSGYALHLRTDETVSENTGKQA